jgi:hypothetical protein
VNKIDKYKKMNNKDLKSLTEAYDVINEKELSTSKEITLNRTKPSVLGNKEQCSIFDFIKSLESVKEFLKDEASAIAPEAGAANNRTMTYNSVRKYCGPDVARNFIKFFDDNMISPHDHVNFHKPTVAGYPVTPRE